MPFRDNSLLISTATTVNIGANGSNGDIYSGLSTLGAKQSTAFVIADGDIGKDNIENFGFDDSIITGSKLFDGNGDGYISFGPNGVLDVDRSSASRAGNDQLSVTGTGTDRVEVIRYLGTKGESGAFAYAAADVRDNFLGHFTKGFNSTNGFTGGQFDADVVRHDSSVASETFNFAGSKNVLLIDNATGLNFGGDTINGFGSDDLLVTTSKLFDRDNSGIVKFGDNAVLDLSGAGGPSSSDPATGPGGQIDMNTPNRLQVTFLEDRVVNGVHYYVYGSSASALDLFAPTV